MRRAALTSFALTICFVAATALGAASASGSARAAGAPGNAATAETAFALKLLPRLAAAGNVVYSPYSIDTALSMADAGAAGSTATQIDQLLDVASQGQAVADARAIRTALDAATATAVNAPTLDVANALWTQSGLRLQRPFVGTLTDAFGAPPQSTNFAQAPSAALQTINGWVSSHTAGVIRKILAPGTITPLTKFVLANAIYLKAHWSNPFDGALSSPAAFSTATGNTVQVPYMKQEGTSFAYGAGPGYQAIDLPYTASSLSMLAIMPRDGSLAAFERGLTTTSLAAIEDSLKPYYVNLKMPKLDLSTQRSLVSTLQALGMTDAFGPQANFTAITTQVPLSISLVEHAANLRVDQQGTVATAATVVVGPATAVRPRPEPTVTLTLDHPFLLLLRDDRSGTILFVAAVANPATG